MYEELIKRLRTATTLPVMNGLCQQAADAIEELSKYANYIGRMKCEGWYLQQTKYHDGYHAVVTMSLPEPPKEET